MGERLSADVTAAELFCVKFQKFIEKENFIPYQIYNTKETGLYWKYLPTKTLASKAEKSFLGHKSFKELIIHFIIIFILIHLSSCAVEMLQETIK